MNQHILLAYSFEETGQVKPIGADAISKYIQDDQLAWIHMDANHPDTKKWLEKQMSYLDPYIIDALLADETRPRSTQINDGLLLNLRGVNLNENASPEDMVSIRLWIDKHRIISVRRRKLKAIEDIKNKIELGKGPKNSGQFLCMLISSLFERMNPVLGQLDDTTDDIEERILESLGSDLRESIVAVRKRAIMFRRYLAPQREAIAQLKMSDLSWLTELHKRHLQELHNHITRYIEDLDAVRERAQIVKDELANMLADKLNKNMYMLSVIAAIFLPLGFLTGLLGINVGGIPGTENPDAFWIFSGLLVFLIVLQAITFKLLRWF